MTNREIRLKSRPTGLPTADNFELVETPVPEPGPGQVLVRNLYMSVDPYMRGRMVDRKSYVPPFQLGEPLNGGAVGEVVASQASEMPVGAYVLNDQGWRDYLVAEPGRLTPVDPALAPLSSYLGVMGMPGMTAYFGLLEIGKPQPGETVFVSAAAGAVGSVVCQIAKIRGCRVVASAGSDAKIRWLEEKAGVDAAFNYKSIPVNAGLARHAKEGIDIYFENVGGDHLEAALGKMNNFGRVVVCGMISLYNATEMPTGPRNIGLVIGKRLRIQGFIVSDFREHYADFYREMGSWVRDGRIAWEETVVEGLDHAPDAFIGLFQGENLGKMVVKIA